MPRLARTLALAALTLCAAAPAPALDLALYAELLARHTREVDDLARVRVDYAALARSEDWRRLVASLEASDPAALRTRAEQLAFWINAYNVLAIDLVARHWPVESIRDVGSFFFPVWKREAGRIGGEAYSLDRIEHEIVRPLGDPRAHAAVICASTSCPPLPRTPFVAARLDAQLDRATRTWLADPGKGLRVDREAGTVLLSKIFDWFPEDFEAAGGVLAFAAGHAPEAEARWIRANTESARIEYMEYDWRVNATR